MFKVNNKNMQLPAGKSPLATIGLIDYKTSFGEKPIKTLKTEILDGILQKNLSEPFYNVGAIFFFFFLEEVVLVWDFSSLK